MIHQEFENKEPGDGSSLTKSVCNMGYLEEMMGENNNLILGIIDEFLTQIPEELRSIETAISNLDYATIKGFAHTMKSSVSIMDIGLLVPVLQEMESLARSASQIERIIELNQELILICNKAISEIKKNRINYIKN